MERVSVFHQEFPTPHHPKTRADFIAEFGLDLIDVERQLLVAGKITPHQVGYDFFVRWSQAVFALMAVDKTLQFRTIRLPTPGFLPQFGRLGARHQNFQRTGAIHFFADDLLHFAQHS